MKSSSDQEEKFLITLADVLHLFRKSKKTILKWALFAGFAGIVFALFKPIRYQADGTFREKGMKTNNVSTSSVIQLLSGASLSGSESEAASLMISRKILKDVVEKLHMQAELSALSDIETPSKLVVRNLNVAWAAYFSSSPKPVLDELCCPLKITALRFTGELPLSMLIKLHSDGHYEVMGGIGKKHSLGEGMLGEPFTSGELTFTLASSDAQTLPLPQQFAFAVKPIYQTIKDLNKVLKVEPSKLDKSLLKIQCEHRDRRFASAIVNAVMESYQNYLKNYHSEIAVNQLDYLNQRRDQLTDKLNNAMQRHADLLTDDLSNAGFIEASKEIDFLAISQRECKQKMLDNELEIKRLSNIKPGSLAYYHRYSNNEGDPSFINSMLSDIRALKQQRDALEIELQKKSTDQGANLYLSFEQQLKELKEVQQNSVELQRVMEHFQQGSLAENNRILDDPRFLLKGWLERVQKAQTEGPERFHEIQENFYDYLNNLQRSFGVHERILQERLTHQQNPSGEYKGISLDVATNLYLDYSKQVVQIEGTIRQNLFFIHQLEDPEFEITSLSSGVEDEVSHNMIRKASELLLNLRDQNNQSLKEQDRIKEELKLQRTFLTMHLNQMVQLMELNKQLIDEKIFALQNVSLELIHEKISLMEKNLQDYLKSRLNNLHQERTLIQRHLDNIHSEMASLPQKWVSEQLLTQEVETNQKIVEEIAKLVESKNISHKLDVIQSAPVDAAIVPLHPVPPKVFLWGLLGFFLGGFLGSGYVFGKTLKKGVPATPENLNLLGFHVSGRLGVSQTEDTETLRRLQTFINGSPLDSHKEVLLLQSSGPVYASHLADLLIKRGKRVITLDLDVDDSYKIAAPGLLQVLQGSISHLPIRKGKHGDWIGSGGSTLYFNEILHAAPFAAMRDELKKHYDWILAVSSLAPASGEAESLASGFPYTVVTLTDETVDDLGAYNRLQELYPEHRFTFMFVNDF